MATRYRQQGVFKLVKNLNASNVKGNNYVAGIVGKLTNVDLEYCFVVDNDRNNIKECIEGDNYVAGLAAMIDNANVGNCYATISVKSNNVGSGLIAIYIGDSNFSEMTATYFIGDVTGVKVAGRCSAVLPFYYHKEIQRVD